MPALRMENAQRKKKTISSEPGSVNKQMKTKAIVGLIILQFLIAISIAETTLLTI